MATHANTRRPREAHGLSALLLRIRRPFGRMVRERQTRPSRHYVSGEICLVLTLPNGGQQPEPRAVYNLARTQVNDAIRKLLPLHGGPKCTAPRDSLRRDLAPSNVWRQFRVRGDGVLQPFTRHDSPFVLLEQSEGVTTALNFYSLGLEPRGGRNSEQHRDLAVRELVNVLNRDVSGQLSGRDAGGGWEIIAATPNWLMTVANDSNGGSPGTPPEPVPPPLVPPQPPANFTFTFADRSGNGASAHTDDGGNGQVRVPDDNTDASGVIVAVLDASPSQAQVDAAAQRYPHNTLLHETADHVSGVKLDGPLSLTAADFAHLTTILPNWPGLLRAWRRADQGELARLRHTHYNIADHGLFVAGIIKDIAPGAEIHLIRVLDDAGMGDLFGITMTLAALPAHLREHEEPRRPIIVNLSLTMGIPPAAELLPLWFPHTHTNAAAMRQWWSDISTTLTTIHQSLRTVTDWLEMQNVLVVAAAGNDSFGVTQRHEPCLPARYDNVLGVAAVNVGGQPASFSNRGDEVLFGNGVATFGGDARPNAHTGAPENVRDAKGIPVVVRGIFSAPCFPLGAGANRTGWAFWSGTSFATPVISGIAANLWATDIGALPRQVLKEVVALAAQPEVALDCPAIMAAQVPV